MNIRQQLLREHSRTNADFVENYVAQHQGSMVELMACFFSDEIVVAQRAAQVVGNLGRSWPDWLEPWWAAMLDAAQTPIHDAIQRNVARYFSELEMEIPAEIEQKAAHLFADWFETPNMPVAISAFAMQFVADRVERYPELKKRLVATIYAKLPTAKPGFRNRAEKLLSELEKTS